MRRYMMAVVLAVVPLALGTAVALAQMNQPATMQGVLIDNACGAKMLTKADPQAAAAEHPKSCAVKEACAASGYAIMTGGKLVKFDDNGNKLAKEYLANPDFGTSVSVTGTEQADGTLAVTAVNPIPTPK